MRARQLLLLFLAIVLPLQAVAQDRDKPIVEVEFKEDETIPGQYLTLRVTVLVPTWMPEPVAFPSLDVPNLRIRLPERSTSPTSRTIDGNSWSGVSRRYLVSPMVPGTFSIPGQNLQVTYADPQTSEPVKAELAVDPVTLRGIVPKSAEGLDPFIAAKDLSLFTDIGASLPGVDWYDIDGKKVQTATLAPGEISATGAPVSASDRLADWDLRTVIGFCTTMLLLGLMGFLAWPYLRRQVRAQQARKMASKSYALKRLLFAIRQKDLSTTIQLLDDWARRTPVTPAADLKRIERALLPITSARYGAGGSQERSKDWQALSSIVKELHGRQPSGALATTLPALNP